MEAAPKPKRKLSAAGRRAIIAATKKRWEAVRAAKAQQEKAARKAARQKTAVKKAAVQTAQPKAAKNSTSAKTAKALVKKAANKSAPVTPQHTATAESASMPEVVM